MGSQVITIAQQKGGAGKTTLAVHLAVSLMQRGYRIAVIDTDPQGTLSRWHQLREEVLGKDKACLQFSSTSGWRVGSEVSRLRRTSDIILIDSPPHVETDARTAIRSADFALVPVQPSPADLWATEGTLRFCKAERIPFRIVFNRVNPNARLTEMIREELGDSVLSILGNRVVFASALLEGKGVTETAPHSAAAEEIEVLTDELLRIMSYKKRVKAKDYSESRAAEVA